MANTSISDTFYTADGITPSVGSTILLVPLASADTLITANGSPYIPPYPSAVTNGSGVATLSMPQQSSITPSTLQWALIGPVGILAGQPPNVTGPVNIATLIATYGWTSITNDQLPPGIAPITFVPIAGPAGANGANGAPGAAGGVQVAGDIGGTTNAPTVVNLSNVSNASLGTAGIAASAITNAKINDVAGGKITGSASIPYTTLPIATANTGTAHQGAVIPDGSTISITGGGVIAATGATTLIYTYPVPPTATPGTVVANSTLPWPGGQSEQPGYTPIATLLYKLAYVTPAGESPLSTASASVTTTTGNQVVPHTFSTPPADVLFIRLYRQPQAGGSYKMVAELPPTSTAYNDALNDAHLGAAYGAGSTTTTVTLFAGNFHVGSSGRSGVDTIQPLPPHPAGYFKATLGTQTIYIPFYN